MSKKDRKEYNRLKRAEARAADPEKYREYQRQWRDKNPGYDKEWREKNKERFSGYQLKHKYGMTQQEFDAMLNSQGGECAICSNVCSSGECLSVDHDHETGKIRALLCRRCNLALGMVKEDERIAKALVEYIAAYKPGEKEDDKEIDHPVLLHAIQRPLPNVNRERNDAERRMQKAETSFGETIG